MIRKIGTIIAALVIVLTVLPMKNVYAVDNVTLFTPFTGTTAIPGETVSYTVDVINSGSSIQSMSFTLENVPEGWEYKITADGRDIRELSVRGDSEQKINLDITLPLDANKGDYRFQLVAANSSGKSILPLLVEVTEQGSAATELTSEQANLQGHADTDFNYTVTLRNRTANQQNYALTANVGEGWTVTFKSGSDSISSIQLDPNSSEDLTVTVTPPENVEAGTYEIPIKAQSGSTSAELTLEAVITGTYDMQLSTPDGNLSADIVAGGERTVQLVVTNTGTAPLAGIELTSSTPPNWEVEFDQKTVGPLEPGDKATVKATVKAPDEAIAGDYVINFKATAPEVSSEATFRISVKTSTLWGIVAILIIAGVVGGLYYIFKKYGRR